MASITLITGSPGSGKSTIGRALAEQVSGGVHIKVDEIRESVVDYAGPGEFTSEALRQFMLARQVAIHWARTYADAGHPVIVDDVCIPESFGQHYAALNEHPQEARVLLAPSRDTLIKRINERGGPYAEFFVQNGLSWVLELIEAMPKEEWIVVDSSELSVEETVQAVVKQLEMGSS